MNTTARARSEVHDRLARLGVRDHDAKQLRRIAMTLHNWHEKECGTDHGCIERDEVTGKAYWLNSTTMKQYPVRDMETGATTRLVELIKQYPRLVYYVQTDPRGASVYILTREQATDGHLPIDSLYTRGVAVY